MGSNRGLNRRGFLRGTLNSGIAALAGARLPAAASTVPLIEPFPIVPVSKPVFSYPAGNSSILVLHPSSRHLERDGRQGLNFTSIHGRAALPRHTIGARRGTVALWVLPLQEISPQTQHPNFAISNPSYDEFVFLSDREAVQDVPASNFCLFQSTHWYPGLTAKFVNTDGARWGQAIAQATANYFEFLPHHWYQMVATWDRDKGDYRIYANGVLVAVSDTFSNSVPAEDMPAPNIFFGSPGYAMGKVDFFDQLLSPAEIGSLFMSEGGQTHNDLQATLEARYTGGRLTPFSGQAIRRSGWTERKNLSLTDAAQDAEFFQQGCGPCLRFTPQGLRITTPSLREFQAKDGRAKEDMTRMYLWTRDIFEGDLYLTVEFTIHQHGGLALLMFQAAGMQGEDFLNDYPLRSDGSMRVVTSEDVRNYHWEFYREMFDTRNDLVTHALIKNPWALPLAFQVEDRHWELNRWYRLTFIQEEARLRGAIDNIAIFDVTDSGLTNNGPVMRQGRVALRAMMRSDITFRNLKISTRPNYA